MTSTLLLVAAGLATPTLAAAADPPGPYVTTTSQPCGNGISAVHTTLHNVTDPTTLSAAQLSDFGYPPRPTDPAMVPVWTKALQRGLPAGTCNMTTGHPGSPGSIGPQAKPTHGATPDNLPPEYGLWAPNWSGNVANNNPYYIASAYWTMPTVYDSNNFELAFSSQWAGVGQGLSLSYPLVQAGSEGDVNNGLNSYYLWWEIFPQNSQQVVTSPGSVVPGDLIYSVVTDRNNVATFGIYDLTSSAGGSYSYTTGTFASDGTAEWIDERTELGTTLYHLPVQNVTFSSAGARTPSQSTNTGVGNLPHYYVNMGTCVAPSTLMDYPGPISTDGWSFTDTWANYGDVHAFNTCRPG